MKDAITHNTARGWPVISMILGLVMACVCYLMLGPPFSEKTGLRWFGIIVLLYLIRWFIALIRSETTQDYVIYVVLLIFSPVAISLLVTLAARYDWPI